MESASASLHDTFSHFTGGKKVMDGKTFAKCCKDTKLICKKYSTTDVDLMFAKVKAKAERTITYE
jgi:hypothetical protein